MRHSTNVISLEWEEMLGLLILTLFSPERGGPRQTWVPDGDTEHLHQVSRPPSRGPKIRLPIKHQRRGPCLQVLDNVQINQSANIDCCIFSVLFPKTWSEFVTCIKRYTSDCLTPDQVLPPLYVDRFVKSFVISYLHSWLQRSDFNRAVGDSINSVHKMCTNEAYKRGEDVNQSGCA